jgi:hypothetical protein
MYTQLPDTLPDAAVVSEITFLNPVNALEYGCPGHYIHKAFQPIREQVIACYDIMQDTAFLRLHMLLP